MHGAATKFTADYNGGRAQFGQFARAVARTAWRRFASRFNADDLRREKRDEKARRAAASDPAALASYLEEVASSMVPWLAKLRRMPEAVVKRDPWSQDLVGAVQLRLVELLRRPRLDRAFYRFERLGKPAWYQVRDEVLNEVKAADRRARTRQPSCAVSRILRPDEALDQRQTVERFDRSPFELIRPRLSPTIARYLDAIVVELDSGRTDRTWGLQQRVADYMDCSKSRVSEAMEKIRVVARQLELDELLDMG